MDHRLEAIAGKPVVDVDEPTVVAAHDVPVGTIVVVGVYMFRAGQNTTYGQGLIYHGAAYWQSYVRRDPGEFYLSYVEPPGLLSAQDGQVFGVAAAASPGVELRVGRATGTTYNWEGPIRGLVYDRELTDYQIQRIIQHLMRELKQQ